jgi:hypothetical protein
MDTVLAMRRVWYRVISDLYTQEHILQEFADVANKWQGTNLQAEDVLDIINEITYWPLQDEADEYFFAEDSIWNARKIYESSLEFWANTAKQIQVDDVDLDTFLVSREIHGKL